MITRNLAALVAAGMFAIASLAQASTVDVMNDDHDSALSELSNSYNISARTLLTDTTTARTPTVQPMGGGTAQFTTTRRVTAVPEMSALFPILGLLVAVASTTILRRRRMAKVNS